MFDYAPQAGSYRINKYERFARKYGLAILTGVVFLIVGVLIGYFSHGGDGGGGSETADAGPCLGPDVPDAIIQDADPSITQKIIDEIKADNIRDNLRRWSSYAHVAGTEGDDRLAQEVADRWKSHGLDYVTTETYDVLLSQPDKDHPNAVLLYDDTGAEVFRSAPKEQSLRPEDDYTNVIPPFHAYSPKGDVEGDVYYVNYCRVEDFEYIVTNTVVNLTDNIVICRYGKIFRGDKVQFAARYGAAGAIVYSDPADYAPDQDSVYPHSWYLPPSGVQRGTAYAGTGDIITPGYPAKDYAYRIDEKNATGLPTIPSHPIGYADAYQILRHLSGTASPAGWRGGLNVSYDIGPGLKAKGWKARLNVTTSTLRAPAPDVFGYIYGSVEPDRYVLLGNHRDAWAFGAVDPTSGTAVVTEISRVLGLLVKQGWRPRRTIVFCSWGAEEFGLLGSYEWVEDHLKILEDRAVVYVNLDVAIDGNFSMHGSGVPLVYEAMYDVAKRIASPNDAKITMYDEWLATFPKDEDNVPSIGGLGTGSDYAGFLVFAGISALDLTYTYDPKLPISGYPVYHSSYETFYLVENFIDPGFTHSAAIGRYAAEMVRYMADSLILPLNVKVYASELKNYVTDLQTEYGQLMADNGAPLDNLTKMIDEFGRAAEDFTQRLKEVNKKNPLQVRDFNDRMIRLERAFTDANGLPDRPLYRHLLFAPSSRNSYAGSTFPGLVDLLGDSTIKWEEVKRHLATLTFVVHSAIDVLSPYSYSQK